MPTDGNPPGSAAGAPCRGSAGPRVADPRAHTPLNRHWAATTTLAEGIDLPFRNTIIADWLVCRGSAERPMPPLL
ncbi:MAG: hypothetical protein R6T85_11580, partial [Egibacteraceae bacterium]